MSDWKSRAIPYDADWKSRAEGLVSSEIPEETGVLKAGALGAAEGATFGFADEIAGALAAAPELLKGGDVSAKYNEARKAAEEQIKQAHEDQPAAAFVGELAGGLAVPFGAVGKAGKALSLLDKIKRGATIGAAAGGLSGLGATESITDVPQVAKDVSSGVVDRAVTGGVLEGALHGLGKAADLATKNFDLPKNIKKGYTRGKESVNLLDEQDLYGKARSEVKENIIPALEEEQALAKEATEAAENKFARDKADIENTKAIILENENKALVEKQAAAKKELQEKQLKANKELLGLSSDVKEAVATHKKLAKAKNYEDQKELANDIVDQSKQLQDNLKKVKENLKPEFDKMDDFLTKGGVTIDMNPGIEAALAKANEYKIDLPINRLPGVSVTEDGVQIASNVSPKQLRVFRNSIQESVKEAKLKQDNRLASALKEILNNIKNQLDKKVGALGDKALADEYTILDYKRANLFRLEELINRIDRDPVTGETLTGNKTIGAVKSFLSETNPTQIDLAQDVRRYIRGAAPEEAEQIIFPLQQLAEKQRQIESFTPEVDISVLPQQKALESRKAEIESLLKQYEEQVESMSKKLSEEDIAAHPDIQQLEMQKLAMQKPEATSSPIVERSLGRGATQKPIIEEDVKRITDLLARSANKGTNEEKLVRDELLSLVNNTKDDSVRQKMMQAVDDYNLSQVARKKAMLKQSGPLGWLGTTAEAGATIGANFAGRAEKAVTDKARNFLESGTFMSMLPKLITQVPEKYANLLRKIEMAPSDKRHALMYTLLQEPEFRQIVKDIMPGSEEEK